MLLWKRKPKENDWSQMHYSADDLHREDILDCNRLLGSSKSTGSPASRIPLTYLLSDRFHRWILHYRICVTAFWQACFMCLFIVGMIILRGPLDYLPWSNVNVRGLERPLPIIAAVLQGGSVELSSYESQNVC